MSSSSFEITSSSFKSSSSPYNLVRMFKNIPLITVPMTNSEFYSVVQSAPTAVYAQIEKDLTEAITNLPATVSGSPPLFLTFFILNVIGSLRLHCIT